MRIFHVVESLDRGAVENWLVSVFVESRKTHPDWEWTFYCMLDRPGRLEETVIRNGGGIIRSPVTVSGKLSFLRHLRAALRMRPYDILHVHHDYLSGYYLLAAAGIRFRKRILHIHNNDRWLPVGNAFLRRALLRPLRWLSLKSVDEVLCISEFTEEDYRQGYASKSPSFHVLYYGIPMGRFAPEPDRTAVRARLSVPERACLLLFTGRMNREKNPVFVVDVLSALVSRGTDAYAVFVGKGEQEELVRKRSAVLGVEDRVRILGWSDDIPGLMKTADAFVFPRLEYPREGLGLVVVEAQCAGLPLFITPGIVDDAIIVPSLAHRNLPEQPELWAEGIAAALQDKDRVDRGAALRAMEASPFELSTATRNLLAHYS